MYKTVIRTIYSGSTIYDKNDGSLVLQNAAEADAYLAETYPSTKFNLVTVNYLGEVKLGETVGLRYSWHFVSIDPKAK